MRGFITLLGRSLANQCVPSTAVWQTLHVSGSEIELWCIWQITSWSRRSMQSLQKTSSASIEERLPSAKPLATLAAASRI